MTIVLPSTEVFDTLKLTASIKNSHFKFKSLSRNNHLFFKKQTNEEMDDRFSLFNRFIANRDTSHDLLNEMAEMVKNLAQSSKIKDQTISTLNSSLEKLTRANDFPLTSKYYHVQELNESLKGENKALKTKVDELERDLNVRKRSFEEKLSSERQEFENKKNELLQELYKVQSLYNSQLSEVEKNHKKQLVDSNQKLRDGFETAAILRTELRNIKEEFTEYKREMKQKVFGLQQKLLAKKVESSNAVLEDPNRFDDSFEHTVFNKRPVPVYSGSLKSWSSNSSKPTPSLIDLTRPKDNSKPKKRRLYNPEDYSCLDNIDQN